MCGVLLKVIGLPAVILHDDPCAFDRYRWMQKNLAKGADVRTLDVGSGMGAFSLYAAKNDNNVVGLSFVEQENVKAAQYAHALSLHNVSFKNIDLRLLDKYKAELGLFDQIICFETIEHILDDKKLLKDLVAILKPGGRLLLTTPYKNYRELLGDSISATEDGGHVRKGYLQEEMQALFEGVGLQVIKQEYLSGLISQQLTNLLRVIGRRNKRVAWSVTLPLRVFQVLDCVTTKLTGYPYLSIAVIGKKI